MRATALTLALATGACAQPALPEEGHLVVYLETDAPLPTTGIDTGPDAPMPLVDTVSFEIVDERGARLCPACAREFSLTTEVVDRGATFTILGAAARRGARVHARAFRAENGPDSAAIEVWARVPELPASGARPLTLELPLAAMGRALGSLESPGRLVEGAPQRPRTLAAESRRQPCAAPLREGTACVPGGAFWMGLAGEPAVADVLPPRVVALHPFAIDVHEVTVRSFRALGRTDGVEAHSGSLAGTGPRDFCTFTPGAGRFDDYPINCVSWAAARAYCLSRGGDLPTEAQFEYLLSGTRSLRHPWGRDRPACEDAVVSRGPRSELWPGYDAGLFGRHCAGAPHASSEPDLEKIGFARPVTRSSYGRDQLPLRGGAVRDLAGNLAEWARDRYEDTDGPCWKSRTLQQDPLCAGEGAEQVLRGGSWTSATPDSAFASFRQPIPSPPNVEAGIAIGFRCAYPDR